MGITIVRTHTHTRHVGMGLLVDQLFHTQGIPIPVDLILVMLSLMFSLNVTALLSQLTATAGAAVGMGGVRTVWTRQSVLWGQGVMRVVVMMLLLLLSSVALVAIVLGALVIKW